MAWTRWSLTLLCCCAAHAWAGDAWCRAGGTPALTFEWVPKDKAEPSVGSVRVKDASGKVVQVLDGLENYYHDTGALGTDVDFNNDGCPDLKVTNSVAGIGNESLSVFLYNRATRRFEPNQALSEIGGLDIDSRNRNCVTGFWKGGAADVHSERHCWHKGKLVKDQEWDVSPRYNGEGEFQCYQHDETTYRGGKKHTHTDCTKEF